MKKQRKTRYKTSPMRYSSIELWVNLQ